MHRRFSFRQAQGLASIEFAEINQLGDVGIGFGPVLPNFEDHPGSQFKLALEQDVSQAEQQRGALLNRGAAPTLECLQCGLHRGLHVLGTGLLMQTHDF